MQTNTGSLFVTWFLTVLYSKRGALEHCKFLPALVLSLRVTLQQYVHRLSHKEVVRAQGKTCNSWTRVGEFILDPGSNLLSCIVALNKMLYVPFSEKETNGTGDYTSPQTGHVRYYYFSPQLSSLFPLYRFFLINICAVQNQIINSLRTRSYFILLCTALGPTRLLHHECGH